MPEANEKAESKPVVESKPAIKPKRKVLKILILSGILVVAGSAVILSIGFLRPGHKPNKPERVSVKAILALDPFLVNLADPHETRFVKTTFQLGLEKEWKGEAKNSAATAAMRDSIISLLSSKTSDQILTAQGKDQLRDEIRARMNALSPDLKVIEVYIVDIVVQL
jgi:flagellar protein FliL